MRVRSKSSGKVYDVDYLVAEDYSFSLSEVDILVEEEDNADVAPASGRAQVCPVCGGRGSVSECFYVGTLGSPIGSTMCRSCQGRGYVVVCDNEKYLYGVSGGTMTP